MLSPDIPLTGADLQRARRLYFDAALQTLAGLPPAPAARPSAIALRAQLQAERDQASFSAETSLLPALLAGDSAGLAESVGPVPFNRLIDRIAEAAGLDKADVEARAQVAFASLVNTGSRWIPFSKSLEIGGRIYLSRFTPLNQAFDPAFADYGQTGYASPSAYLPVTEAAPLARRARATNAWRTELVSAEGDVLLAAFRSGAFSELGVADPAARMALARAKAGDLLRAVAVEHFKRLSPAEQQAALSGQAVPEITLVSTSLLTSFLGAFNHQTLQENAAALEGYHGSQTCLEVCREGRRESILVRFHIINFNKAVNELRWLGASRSRVQLTMNAEALRRLRAFKEAALTRLAAEPSQNAVVRLAVVRQLWKRLERVADRRGGLSSGSGSAYELPALVSNLAYQLGALVHYNCLSGKDRTGLADAEAKLLAYQIDRRVRTAQASGTPLEQTQLMPRYSAALAGDDAEAAVRLIFESGNLEIQQINTGVPGYKVRGSLLGRFGGGRLARILASDAGQAVLRSYLNVDAQVSFKAGQFSRMINALSALTGA